MYFRLKETLDALAWPLYVLTGRRPWRPGYYTAKKRAITSAIDGGLLRDGVELPSGHGRGIDERVVEYPWVFAQHG